MNAISPLHPVSPGRVPLGAGFVVTERMLPGEPVVAVFRRLAVELGAADVELLGLMVFGSLEHQGEIAAAMHVALGDAHWPVTWVEGASCEGLPLAGVQAFAVAARKVRRLGKGDVIAGFAGATADAFTLFERLESKLDQYPGQLMRACVELAKDWRMDRDRKSTRLNSSH